jgi:hypothetical protein
MAEYPAFLEEMGLSQDGGISRSPRGNELVPRWRNIQLTWRKWACPKMEEYPDHLEEMSWSQDGGISSSPEGNGRVQDGEKSNSPGGNGLVLSWRNIQLTWRKWAGPKMAEYPAHLGEISWSQDGGISSSPGRKEMVPRWHRNKSIWR